MLPIIEILPQADFYRFLVMFVIVEVAIDPAENILAQRIFDMTAVGLLHPARIAVLNGNNLCLFNVNMKLSIKI